jgi:hypothetical protein
VGAYQAQLKKSHQPAPEAIAKAPTTATAKLTRPALIFQVIPITPLGFPNISQIRVRVCACTHKSGCSGIVNSY